MENTTDHCKLLLQNHGLKVTHQRLRVYQVLLSDEGHPSAEALFEQLAPEMTSLSLGTVYRVLDNLVVAGLAQKFMDENGKMRFDAKLQPHHHLVCEDTKEILDFEDHKLNQLIEDYFRANPIPGFQVSGFQLNINGIRPQHS